LKVVLRLDKGILYPYDDESADYLNKQKSDHFSIDLKKARNPQFHKYAFAMFRMLYDMIDSDLDFKSWRRMLTILAGYSDVMAETKKDGTERVYVSAQSLSFENFDQSEFRECFLAVHGAFCSKYGDLLTVDQLDQWAVM
jgi:hypothetical protein